MTDDDTELFLAEMAGVKPLQQDDRVNHSAQTQVTEAQLNRREAAQANEYFDRMPLDPVLLAPKLPEEVISFKRQGVQDQVFRNLRLGKYKHPSTLDLRGLRLREARELLVKGILAACAREERCLLLVHGKGINNKPFPALIKSAVCCWLMQMEEVMGFNSAIREEGGTGALYIMLIKSQAQKEIARETNHKGSGFR